MIRVDENRCVGCGQCVMSCLMDALRVWGVAEVTADCTGCLECIDYCAVEALEVPTQ
ncbi:MAG: 4Fe-4S binding protein [Thermodesulfobacteriota bacterium]|nr:4Fe-4S binding protein [Thermodesulfobacteriota bacterium]